MSPSLTRKTFEMKQMRGEIHKYKEAGTLTSSTLVEVVTGTTAAEGAKEAMHEVQMALQGVEVQRSLKGSKIEASSEMQHESNDAGTKGPYECEGAGWSPPAETARAAFPGIIPPLPGLAQTEATEDATPEQEDEYTMKMKGMIKCIECGQYFGERTC